MTASRKKSSSGMAGKATDSVPAKPQISEKVRDLTASYRRVADTQPGSGNQQSFPALLVGSKEQTSEAAAHLAQELQLPLYRIDLSDVVSKYIGETEENLSRLFTAAEEAGAVLFFEEADALFGKSTKVKDSHDRFANTEVHFLLRKLEQYRGLAILATNSKAALDDPLLRRFAFSLEFPVPGGTRRRKHRR
jgi:SpoVK/Ycf46/Vps4 family AAA+-type ATPase